jgi:hypothetical protein
MTRSTFVLVLALALAACGGDAAEPDSAAAGPKAQTFFAPADIPSAGSVYDARKKSPGDEVTVVGRVRDIAGGFAAFTVVDQVLEYCGQGAEKCGCPTPWDFCCLQAETVNEASLPVEFRDAKGQPVETNDVGLRLLDLVVVKGKLEKTESGGLLLVTTSGWFRRERPQLPEGLHWPTD